jgi:hypothetical protein
VLKWLRWHLAPAEVWGMRSIQEMISDFAGCNATGTDILN